MMRALALAACLAAVAGCNDDDDDGNGGSGRFGFHNRGSDSGAEFFDDFSGSFPAPDWNIREGSPFTHPQVGHSAPGLAMRPFGDRIRVRGVFKFATADPLTLSFEVATYEKQKSSRFRAKIRDVATGSNHATFELKPREDEIRVRIFDSDEEIDFDATTAYDTVTFTVDDGGTATWWINGVALMSRGGFPAGNYQVEFETNGGNTTKFVVDNVRLTRP